MSPLLLRRDAENRTCLVGFLTGMVMKGEILFPLGLAGVGEPSGIAAKSMLQQVSIFSVWYVAVLTGSVSAISGCRIGKSLLIVFLLFASVVLLHVLFLDLLNKHLFLGI